MPHATRDFNRISKGTVQYKNCPAGATTGLNGNSGSYIDKLVAVVTNNAAMTVDIQDGAQNAVRVLQNASIATANGTVVLPIEIESWNGAWNVITGNGVNVVATGHFV